jgi:hypothetical protein
MEMRFGVVVVVGEELEGSNSRTFIPIDAELEWRIKTEQREYISRLKTSQGI